MSALYYDVLGRLARVSVAGTTTDFHYDGDALVGEYVGTTLTRRYVHGGGVDEPPVQYNGASVGSSYRRYLHADHQGSIIAHSDFLGGATQNNAYDPYGIPKSTNDGRFGYTGQTVIPQLGLNYYKARCYAPRLGRFLHTDPIFYEDDMNMYAYVSGDPINAADPSGLLADDCLPMETGQGQVCPGPELTITREDRWSAAQNGIKAIERKFDAGKPFDSPKEAAEAYCEKGGCPLFAQTGFENGANIIPVDDKYRLSDFVLGSDGPTASIALIGDTRAVADVHVHGSEGFSGGAIFSKGQLNIYDGDIGMNVRRGRDGFVFRGSDGAGWWFKQSAFRKAIANSPNGYFYFSNFVNRIR